MRWRVTHQWQTCRVVSLEVADAYYVGTLAFAAEEAGLTLP
jgi:hypothetical protein